MTYICRQGLQQQQQQQNGQGHEQGNGQGQGQSAYLGGLSFFLRLAPISLASALPVRIRECVGMRGCIGIVSVC